MSKRLTWNLTLLQISWNAKSEISLSSLCCGRYLAIPSSASNSIIFYWTRWHWVDIRIYSHIGTDIPGCSTICAAAKSNIDPKKPLQ
jgi:hypothetical protein